ncbi:MAG: phasin family protein [Hyphomicrobiaceae bacterium]
MSRSKSSSKTSSNTGFPVGMDVGGLQSATNVYQSWLQGIAACNAEATRFFGKRLAKDFEIPTQLANCQSPTDILEVQSSFVQTLIADYADEAQRMSALATEAFANGIEKTANGHARRKS